MRYLLLSAIISGLALASAGSATAQDAAAGAAVFKAQCAGCHSTQEGKIIIGPSLFGIVGRKAGEMPGFKYSPANKASGLTWDEATLISYIGNPQSVVPKTIMPYPGLKDAGQRADLVAFLVTVH
jgi:cytochrome c